MSDLREALEHFDALAAKWPNSALANQRTIVAAARRFLALTETGQRVEWCETHESSAPHGVCDAAKRLDYAPTNAVMVGAVGSHTQDCRIVSKFLADYLTEEDL